MTMTFRGVSLQDNADPKLAAVYFDLVGHPSMPPQVRGEDWIAPGYAGRYQGNRIEDLWTFEIRGFVRGLGLTVDDRTTDFQSNLAAVLGALDMADDPGVFAIASYLGMGSHSVLARPVNMVAGPLRNRGSFQSWSVGFEAIEPWS